MRLTRPTLSMSQPIRCDARDLPGNLFDNMMQKELTTVRGLEDCALGELLTLPLNFG